MKVEHSIPREYNGGGNMQKKPNSHYTTGLLVSAFRRGKKIISLLKPIISRRLM